MNFVYTLKSYKCNKKCPYCITKILRRRAPEDWKQLPEILAKAKAEGKKFTQFVLSGNGETSNYSIETLRYIRDTVVESKMFESCRIQTSGKLFFEKAKLDLFRDWYKEITIVSTDFEQDSKILNYKRNYFPYAMRTPKVRCNIVLTKDKYSWLPTVREAIEVYDTVALKILDGSNKWIEENALPWSEANRVIGYMNQRYYGFIYDDVTRRYWWYTNHTPQKAITMSFGKEHAPDYIHIEEK